MYHSLSLAAIAAGGFNWTKRELFDFRRQCKMTGLDRLTDEELYERMRSGDRGALAALYERHQPALYRYAMRMSGNCAAAEEVAQDVFLHLIGSARYDSRLGSLEAYLYGIARNLLRKLRRAAGTEEIGERPVAGDLLAEMIEDQATAALFEAVRDLPEAFRETVVLCDLEELSYEDAARLMGCPVGTVRSRLHRARALLAGRLHGFRTAGTGRKGI